MKKIYESEFIKCKPISVNASHTIRAFFDKKTGKIITTRVTTKEYKDMKNICKMQIKNLKLESGKPYRIEYDFFLNQQGSDVDNFIKCFQDILEEKIQEKNEKFNDNLFYEVEAKKYFPKSVNDLGVIFKIYEIKISLEKNNIQLKKNNNIKGEYYE
jgi:Holliday junction resolvase RusA-like endonuclease